MAQPLGAPPAQQAQPAQEPTTYSKKLGSFSTSTDPANQKSFYMQSHVELPDEQKARFLKIFTNLATTFNYHERYLKGKKSLDENSLRIRVLKDKIEFSDGERDENGLIFETLDLATNLATRMKVYVPGAPGIADNTEPTDWDEYATIKDICNLFEKTFSNPDDLVALSNPAAPAAADPESQIIWVPTQAQLQQKQQPPRPPANLPPPSPSPSAASSPSIVGQGRRPQTPRSRVRSGSHLASGAPARSPISIHSASSVFRPVSPPVRHSPESATTAAQDIPRNPGEIERPISRMSDVD